MSRIRSTQIRCGSNLRRAVGHCLQQLLALLRLPPKTFAGDCRADDLGEHGHQLDVIVGPVVLTVAIVKADSSPMASLNHDGHHQ